MYKASQIVEELEAEFNQRTTQHGNVLHSINNQREYYTCESLEGLRKCMLMYDRS